MKFVHGDISLEQGFFLDHVLWPRKKRVTSLHRLRAAFPDVRRVLLSDTYRSGLGKDATAPVFPLGFECAYTLMDRPPLKGGKGASRVLLDIPYNCDLPPDTGCLTPDVAVAREGATVLLGDDAPLGVGEGPGRTGGTHLRADTDYAVSTGFGTLATRGARLLR
ncbi:MULTISPECIES: hypothetical protein [unclassified Streptomyces]|uniref:hypothetical protein n=1 Tax=unclassified Streptomyces TaxID=2593676 RepID=UPI00381D0C96